MRLAGVDAARALARRAASPYRFVTSMAITPPERLRIAPPDIRTADSTVADEIAAGYYSFEGKAFHGPGVSPFSITPPSPGWRRTLTGFSWLRHLRPADHLLAQALVADFLSMRKLSRDDPALEPAVVARRMISLLSQSPILLEGADEEFHDAFMLSLGQSARLLWRALASGRTRGADRALCAIALAQFSVCSDAGRKIAPQTTRALAAELNRQILSDGGHISRNPQVAVDLLLDLLPLRHVIAARGLQAPDAVLRAIDRMMPMLRMMQHGDGSLALFNGMGATALDRLANVLAFWDSRGAAPLNAPYSGYQRMEAGDALVLIDAGASPPLEFSENAHAGCLSFEYSLGVERVIVNCGAPAPQHVDAREMARATAAHSTLVLGDRSSARIAPATAKRALAGRIVEGPKSTPVERRALEDETTLKLSHDGYLSGFGLIHARELTLTHDAQTFAGRDRLLAPENTTPAGGSVEFVIRFHLHPRLRVEPRGAGLELTLANGERLLFEAVGARPEIAESIFFASPGGARKCQQIMLRGAATSNAEVRWSFQRLAPGAVPPAMDV